jgi:hypothetical protein
MSKLQMQNNRWKITSIVLFLLFKMLIQKVDEEDGNTLSSVLDYQNEPRIKPQFPDAVLNSESPQNLDSTDEEDQTV